MSINKNTIWTLFCFLSALMSPVLFVKLSFVPNQMIPNLTAVMYILGAVIITLIYRKTDKAGTLSHKPDDYGLVIGLGILAI
ncbi:hypothetical protein J8385_19700, partial [Acinetobacter baumannii]|nr:hypothetical protein [Acinetobacter baumannii]